MQTLPALVWVQLTIDGDGANNLDGWMSSLSVPHLRNILQRPRTHKLGCGQDGVGLRRRKADEGEGKELRHADESPPQRDLAAP